MDDASVNKRIYFYQVKTPQLRRLLSRNQVMFFGVVFLVSLDVLTPKNAGLWQLTQ